MQNPPQKSRFTPLDNELTRETDSVARHALRQRGERLLRVQVQAVGTRYTLPHRVELVLVQQDDRHQVSVDQVRRRRLGRHDRHQVTCTIMASPEWLGLSTDAQILATFAHELGHVALGHCVTERKRTGWHGPAPLVGLMIAGWLLPLLACLTAGWAWSHVLIRVLGTGFIGGLAIVTALAWSKLRQQRQEELAADQFVVRFASPAAFLEDLERSEPPLSSRFYRFMRRLDSWTQTHPCLDVRARAMARTLAHDQGPRPSRPLS